MDKYIGLRMYTVRDVAELFGVKVGTVKGWIWKKWMRVSGYRKKYGRRYAYFTEEEVKRWQAVYYGLRLPEPKVEACRLNLDEREGNL